MARYASVLTLLLWTSSLEAQTPRLLDYQGRMAAVGGEPVADGAYNATFQLYDAAQGGEAVWTENQSISVRNGLFSAVLGQISALDPALFDRPLWLGVNVNSSGELAPRVRLVSAPFALNAERLGGLEAAQLLRSDQAGTLAGSLTLSSGTLTLPQDGLVAGTNQFVLSGGSVGIGTAAPGAKLDVAGGAIRTDGQLVSTGTSGAPLAVSSTVKVDNLNADSLDGLDSTGFLLTSGGTLSGSLTLPANGLAAGTNQLVLSEGNVGIGTAAPGVKLDVGGEVRGTTFRSSLSIGSVFRAGDDATLNDVNEANTLAIFGEQATSEGGLRLGLGGGLLYGKSSNLGIGTKDPKRLLHVHSGGEALQVAVTGAAPVIVFSDTEMLSSGVKGFIGLATGNGTFISGTGADDLVLNTTVSTGDLILATDSVVRMFISGTGNVGIGTTSPVNVTASADLTITGSIAQDGWTACSHLNSWVDYDPGWSPCGYFRDKNGIVHLRGLVRDGTSGSAVIANLPAGYRPAYNEMHGGVMFGDAFCRISIAAGGNITPTGCSTTWTSIDGITFRAAEY